eukprot:1159660-Pelagomonas_calceolata.AAC.7
MAVSPLAMPGAYSKDSKEVQLFLPSSRVVSSTCSIVCTADFEMLFCSQLHLPVGHNGCSSRKRCHQQLLATNAPPCKSQRMPLQPPMPAASESNTCQHQMPLPVGPPKCPSSHQCQQRVARRLKHAQWRAAMRPEHLMQVLQCVRLLSRDETLRRKLDADALKVGLVCCAGDLGTWFSPENIGQQCNMCLRASVRQRCGVWGSVYGVYGVGQCLCASVRQQCGVWGSGYVQAWGSVYGVWCGAVPVCKCEAAMWGVGQWLCALVARMQRPFMQMGFSVPVPVQKMPARLCTAQASPGFASSTPL